MTSIIEFTTEDHHAGQRIDKVLAQLMAISRTRTQQLIGAGLLRINGLIITDRSYQVKLDQHLSCAVPEIVDHLLPKEMALDIVHEDDHLLVLNKPAAMTVHPGAGTADDTLVHGLLHYLGSNISNASGSERPGIVHRLDRNTTGLMVVAKTNDCHLLLSDMLQQRLVHREYIVLVYGMPQPAISHISGYMDRDSRNRTAMKMVKMTSGRWSRTNYAVERSWGDGTICQLCCRLETGRTHQIRLHLEYIKHPVVGDTVYGRRCNHNLRRLSMDAQQQVLQFTRQALHARTLSFIHPINQQPLELNAPLPADMLGLIECLDAGNEAQRSTGQ